MLIKIDEIRRKCSLKFVNGLVVIAYGHNFWFIVVGDELD